MKIGIIGPRGVEKYCEKAELNKDKYIKIVSKVAFLIAKSGNEIVITPDKGSTSELFAQQYLANEGKKIYEIIPLDDKEKGYSWVNTELGEISLKLYAKILIC